MSFGLIMIEVCDANKACTEDIFQLESLFPGVAVMETACMSQCDLCASGPYAYVNNEIVEADSIPSLVQLLRVRIQNALQHYETDNETS